MACGLPLVVTNVPGNRDIVGQNKCGIIVEKENVESIADGLQRLLSDPQHQSRMRETALSAVSKYDWRNVAEQYSDVYRKLINATNA